MCTLIQSQRTCQSRRSTMPSNRQFVPPQRRQSSKIAYLPSRSFDHCCSVPCVLPGCYEMVYFGHSHTTLSDEFRVAREKAFCPGLLYVFACRFPSVTSQRTPGCGLTLMTKHGRLLLTFFLESHYLCLYGKIFFLTYAAVFVHFNGESQLVPTNVWINASPATWLCFFFLLIKSE